MPTSFLFIAIFDILILICYNLNVVNQLVIRVLLPNKQVFKGIMKSLKNLLMNVICLKFLIIKNRIKVKAY